MRLWITRLMIALVIAWNLQAALAFLINPAAFAPAFELYDIPGAAAVRGIAVLFIMWNVPYFVACWHPVRQMISLKQAVVMQTVGLLGETYIFFSLPKEYIRLGTSIMRFIAFDTAGLIILSIALWLIRHNPPQKEQYS